MVARQRLGRGELARGDGAGEQVAEPPAGIRHHYARLAIVAVTGGKPSVLADCRPRFPAVTAISADDVRFDNETCKLPGAATVQDALDRLCQTSGEGCA